MNQGNYVRLGRPMSEQQGGCSMEGCVLWHRHAGQHTSQPYYRRAPAGTSCPACEQEWSDYGEHLSGSTEPER